MYLLPSLFTFGNIILGFYACVRGLRGDFQTAAILIVVAGFLDTFDGRIARMTKTESDFGKEFDSLADIVTFGVAPAFLAHIWGLHHYGRIGWLIPVFYLLCAATRLARFNVQSRSVDSRFFVGLPTPPAAAAAASIFYFLPPRQRFTLARFPHDGCLDTQRRPHGFHLPLSEFQAKRLELMSYGADGQEGGEGPNADVVSWR